ncbi:glycosyltransferase family 4 protein [Desulforamulus aeronauticus]|uniref:Glycosyltransferase involved in cell wall bisynthesis n=1 Tax=Desulforamulus aeronauticus DSM 10349 TaxID=1121421 RepID=A0A1M6V3S2_9FIRM|nr:glycosyltransferase family 4 protein [Desulforamulus aeronauticus]SHK76147.1 Glycosyltransferase involved in cell wall bisynthesis [Desulforamulus aeronauticus DSM 10349]
MKILIVNLFDINRLPPVRNLIEILLAHGHKVTVITYDNLGTYVNSQRDNLEYIFLVDTSAKKKAYKAVDFFIRKKKIRNMVEEKMRVHDIIWTTTDRTVRELGKILLKYKHVMQLMELIEDMPLFPYQKFFKAHLNIYGQRAFRVVVPEYNRAHILKTWWDLKKTPCVLPNKPYGIEIDNPSREIMQLTETIKNEKKKIILYQGFFGKDRNLDMFAQSVQKIEAEYKLYIMGYDNEIRRELCEKYSEIEYIPFIAPPYHLALTQYAYIGILPYVPAKNQGHNSELNALYCAPNKIYEYSAFGLPMIGTDVPGLAYPFQKYGIGVCCKELTVEAILNAIKVIEKNYESMSDQCHRFYEDTDMDYLVEHIISE